jgi:hypothetical protein
VLCDGSDSTPACWCALGTIVLGQLGVASLAVSDNMWNSVSVSWYGTGFLSLSQAPTLPHYLLPQVQNGDAYIGLVCVGDIGTGVGSNQRLCVHV